MDVENRDDVDDTTASPKLKRVSADRIYLTPEAQARLSKWCDALDSERRGIKITRGDLVDFLVLNHAEVLSAKEVHDLEVKHFDEVRFARWALEELKAALARGMKITLADIIASKGATKSPTRTTARKKPSPTTDPTKPASSDDATKPL